MSEELSKSIGELTFKPFGMVSQINIDGKCAISVRGDNQLGDSNRWQQSIDRAEFIVKACNEYEQLNTRQPDKELVEALDRIEKSNPESGTRMQLIAQNAIAEYKTS